MSENSDDYLPERKSKRRIVNAVLAIVLVLALGNDGGGHIVLRYIISGGLTVFCYDVTIMDTGWTIIRTCDRYYNRFDSSVVTTCHVPSRETQQLRTLVSEFSPTEVWGGFMVVPDRVGGPGMFYGAGTQPLDSEARDALDRIFFRAMGACF